MIRGLIRGFSDYFGALRFVVEHRLYSYLVLSGFISLAIGAVIFGVSYGLADDIGGLLAGLYPFEWGSGYITTFFEYVSGGFVVVIGFFLFKYILLICVSPFMGPLSAKVERIVSGEVADSAFSIKKVSYELMRGIRISIRNASREILITVFLIVLGLIPLLTIFVAPLIFLVQSYYTGFGNFDYFLERRANVNQSVAYVKKNRWMAIGNGAAFLLLLLIPIAGLFFAPVLGTIAATKSALSTK